MEETVRRTAAPGEPTTVRTPGISLLLAVGILSGAVLSFEISLTRVLAALLQYHFLFLVLSVALCGLGLGGFFVHRARVRHEVSLPALALLSGASIAGSLLFCLRFLFARFPEAYWLAAVVLLLPFGFAGAFLAEVFARYASSCGKIYGVDLAGAAGASLLTVGLLELVPAPEACLILGALVAGAGLLAASEKRPGQRKRASATATVVALVALVAAEPPLGLLEIPPVPPRYDRQNRSLADRGITQLLFTELGDPSRGTRILETRWTAFSRTDLVETRTVVGDLDYRLVYTDGTAPTPMIRWDGNPLTLDPVARSFPLCDWAFEAAPLGARNRGPAGRVLSIGPGGGLDALLALHHDAALFEGAEIDPSVPQLVRDHGEFNGRLYERPDVRISIADGRAYVRERAAAGHRYGLIFSALTKTTATGTGGMLVESYIHTIEALGDYLEALEDDGLAVWIVDHPLLAARLFATGLAAFGRTGLPTAEATRRLALVADTETSGPYKFAIAVFRSPLDSTRSNELGEAARRRKLTALWLPGRPESAPVFRELAEGRQTLSSWIRRFRAPEFGGADVRPCPDDRPFVLSSAAGVPLALPGLAGLALASAAVFVALSWRSGGRARMSANDLRFVAYFLLLGIGFMLVEIPVAQKLILPLGYPTLALAVILFSLLLGGGLGSLFSQRIGLERLSRSAMLASFAVALLVVAYRPLLEWLGSGLVGTTRITRAAVAGSLLLPLGFFLGIPFPAGLRVFALARSAHIPLVWGVNGIASVAGSLAAAAGGVLFGFNGVLAAGAIAYGCAALLIGTGPKARPGRAAAGASLPPSASAGPWRAVRDSNPRPSA